MATADIADRNPILTPGIDARLDPLSFRPPQAVWKAFDDTVLWGMVTRLAEFFTIGDAERLDQALKAQPGPMTTLSSDCHIASDEGTIRFACGGGRESLRLAGELLVDQNAAIGGYVEELILPQSRSLLRARLQPGTVEMTQGQVTFALSDLNERLSVRLNDGRRLSTMTLRWDQHLLDSVNVTATVTIIDDFDPLQTALQSMVAAASNDETDALSYGAFQRKLIVDDLTEAFGLPQWSWCCELPPLEAVDQPQSLLQQGDASSTVPLFQRHCATCHSDPTTNPPGFLATSEVPSAGIAQCAPRILRRLRLWDQPHDLLTPMPPPGTLGLFAHDEDSWLESTALEQLVAGTEQVLLAQGGAAKLADTIARRYETLPPCLSDTP